MQQKLVDSKTDSLSLSQGIVQDLDFVRRVIAEVLDYEAAKNPALAPVLRAQKQASGKMLRPTLLLLGQKYSPEGSAHKANHLLNSEDFAQSIRSILDLNGAAKAQTAIEEWKNLASRDGGPANRYYLMAAAIELLHLASLIHDDVIDGSEYRRGLPAVWQQAGTAEAVLLGDLLFADCFALMSYSSSPDAGKVMSAMVRAMLRSELLQLQAKREASLVLKSAARRSYLRVIAGKTAAFFALCLSAGAREGGAPEAVLEKLRRLGYSMGMAFQIQDDILDYLGSPQLVGKPLGRDLAAGQITLPLILALDATARGKLSELSRLVQLVQDYWAGEEALLPEIVDGIAARGGFEAAAAAASLYQVRAQRELAALGGGVAEHERAQRRQAADADIRSILQFILGRES